MSARSSQTTHAPVVIVGAGPVGLMLAVQLGLARVPALVLERHPRIRDVPKAGGLSGQIIPLLRHQRLLDRFEAASTAPPPEPRFPWGGMHVDLTRLADPPMGALPLPQPQLEALLEQLAVERGAEVRRGHEVVGLEQGADTVTARVRRPDGVVEDVTADYLVGCDGSRSRVRDLAAMPFPGTTYPEVQRLAAFTVPDSVTVRADGDLEVAGVGRVPFGFTRTERGEYAVGSSDPATLGVYTSEEQSADHQADHDDEQPMTAAEMRASFRRVAGFDLPLGEPRRLTRFTFHARLAERYRDGRVLLAGDAAHLFPAPGVALNVGLLDSVDLAWKLAADLAGWAPAGLLDTYDAERRLAAERTLLHTQAQVAVRRGHDPAAVALRELLQELLVDEQPLRRIGGLMAGDVRYPLPGHERHGLVGAFAPTLRLVTADGEVRLDELGAGPGAVLLDLADRAELRGLVDAWGGRVGVRSVSCSTWSGRPADALLLRPDGHVAWAAAVEEGPATAAESLREALARWCGEPG